MRVVFYISYRNEPELVALHHKLGSRVFSNFIKDALRHAVRPNYKGAVMLPSELLLDETFKGEKIRVNVSIAAIKDGDIITMLQSIKPGMVTRFVKQCTRLYIGNKCLESYFNKDFSNKFALVAQSQVPTVVYQLGESAIQTNIKRKSSTSSKKRIRVGTKKENDTCKPASTTPVQDTVLQQTLSQSTPVSLPEKPSMPVINTVPEHQYYDEPDTGFESTDTEDVDALSLLESLLS